jgi:hypothetical protein
MSDYRSITTDSGSSPNDDAEFNTIGAEIELSEFRAVQDLLKEDYDLTMDISAIADTMEDAGIDFLAWNWNAGLMIHEAIYDHLLEAE